MKIANGIEMLQISDSFMGNPRTIYPTLVYDENTVVLVDTGFPGQLDLFREAMEGVGVAFERINKIILTHHDIDHIGNLSGIVKMLSGRVGVLCHEEEAPYVRGEKTPVKLVQSDPHIHFDKDQSAMSVKRLTKYDVDSVICYHGGLYMDHARERIEELARL